LRAGRLRGGYVAAVQTTTSCGDKISLGLEGYVVEYSWRWRLGLQGYVIECSWQLAGEMVSRAAGLRGCNARDD